MSWKTLYLNNFIRKNRIEAAQNRYLDAVLAANNTTAMIFIVPDRDTVTGGILSIVSLADETKNLGLYNNAPVVVCTMPVSLPLLKYTKFANNTTIVRFELLLSRLSRNARVFVHIPELYVKEFSGKITSLVRSNPEMQWRFNILLQNIDFIPDGNDVEQLKKIGEVTSTTAHKAYSNIKTESMLGCRIHHFSTYVSPEKYQFRGFREKENIVVVSPDPYPEKNEILAGLKKELSNFEFITVRNMTYEDYKSLIARAKYSLTFGEGLDAYLVETIFSGGIGAAVYNDRYFTTDYQGLPFIYRSWDDVVSSFPDDVRAHDNDVAFKPVQAEQYAFLASIYSHDNYIQNLLKFYNQCRFLDEVT